MSNDHQDEAPATKEESRLIPPTTGWNEASLDAAYVPSRSFSEWANLEVDEDAWNRYSAEYKEALVMANLEAIKGLERRMGREAAAETGAVEELYSLSVGQTRTIAVESPGWEQILGGGTRALNIFNSQFEVYEYVKQAAAEHRPMTASFVRELHTAVCRREDTQPKGAYKDRPNHVIRRDGTSVSFAPVNDTEPEMRRLMDEVNGDAFRQAHPVLQAAYIHHGLAHIHPFVDGNGRVARALASFFTCRSIGLPLIIYSDRKLPYLQALEAADRGEFAVFTGYLCDRLIDTMARATQELRSLADPSLAGRLDELVTYIAQQQEPTIDNVRKIGGQLVESIRAELIRISSLIPEESGIALLIRKGSYVGDDTIEWGYSALDSLGTGITFSRPVELSLNADVGVAIARELSSRFIYRIAVVTYNSPPSQRVHYLDLRFEDVFPSLSTAGHARIVLLLETLVGWLINQAMIELRKVLRQAGYDSFSS